MADYTLSVDGRFNDAITGRLKSIQQQLSGVAGGLSNAGKSAVSFGQLIKANVIGNVITGGLKAVANGVSAIAGNLKGVAGELADTSSAWSTFESNMRMNGHLQDDINDTKKELQRFAEQTVYSASDMASTFAQLDAVGIDGVTDLVKGFGGLASAAENPQQAMKTLSQQATQMAAKPKVEWADFKLMLEQTPAGIAAIAKEMGMSTSEMVTAVQKGTISTEDFFNAIKKVGTNDEFTEMATKAKTVGQAMDGLKEAVQNRLLPRFEELQTVGIDTINSIANGFSEGGISGAISALSDKFGEIMDNLDASAGISSFMNSINDAIGNAMDGINNNLPRIIRAGGELVNGLVVGVAKNLPKFIDGIKTLATSTITTIKNNLGGLASTGKQIVDTIISAITDNLPDVLTTGAEILAGIGQSISDNLPELITTAMTIIQQLIDGFTQNLPMLIDAGLAIIQGLVQGITTNIDAFIEGAMQLIGGIVDAVIQAGPTLLEAAVQIVTALVQGLMNHMPEIIEAGKQLLGNIVSGIANNLPSILEKGVEIVSNLANGIIEKIPEIVDTASKLLNQFIDYILTHLPDIIDAGINLVLNLVNGIVSNLPELVNSAVNVMDSFIKTVASHLPELFQKGWELMGKLASGIIKAIPKVVAAIPEILSNIKEKFLNFDWLKLGKDIITGIANGIKEYGSAIWDSMKETVGGAVDKIKGFFGIASPSKLMRDEVGQYISEGVGAGILKGTPAMLEDVRRMNNQLYKSMDSITAGSSTAGYGTTNNTYGNTYGDVNMNIYGAEGQSEERLAMIVRNRLIREYQEEGMVFA